MKRDEFVSMPALILASRSRYRQAMLQRLRLPFTVVAADVDETPLPAEIPQQTALRLAVDKARAVARQHPQAVVIGADQVATMDNGAPVGKPGDLERARAQLRQFSGQTLVFHSALCVIRDDQVQVTDVPTRCQFRRLSDAEIETYLRLEEPFDTAGSAKAEGLGIALMHSMQSDDPTAIIGLPLIALTRMLRQAGINPLQMP